MKIGVTGGLGTGKSTVSKLLAATLQAEYIDTDQLCRLQLEPGAQGYEQFVALYGDRFLGKDRRIDRTLLKEAVFDNGEIRESLEGILHPLVRHFVATRCSSLNKKDRFLVVEVPLLYEVGWLDDFDLCVVVYVPEEICVKRVRARDKMMDEEIRKILMSQLPIDRKCEYGDAVIDNSGTFVSTVHQVGWLSKKIVSRP